MRPYIFLAFATAANALTLAAQAPLICAKKVPACCSTSIVNLIDSGCRTLKPSRMSVAQFKSLCKENGNTARCCSSISGEVPGVGGIGLTCSGPR
ncbi:hypothetical protein M3J07_007484 [Ascochyta lentis]